MFEDREREREAGYYRACADDVGLDFLRVGIGAVDGFARGAEMRGWEGIGGLGEEEEDLWRRSWMKNLPPFFFPRGRGFGDDPVARRE